MANEFEVKGLDELNKALLALPEAISRTIGEHAVHAGCEVIQKAAQDGAPERTGQLIDDIKVKVGSNLDARRASGESAEIDGEVYVSKRSAAKARWAEFGTAPHVINAHGKTLDINGEPVGKAVHHPGQPARPFMRPAFDNNKERAVGAMADDLRANLAIAVEEAKRR
jgi:HK97 gp10 family phage protein